MVKGCPTVQDFIWVCENERVEKDKKAMTNNTVLIGKMLMLSFEF